MNGNPQKRSFTFGLRTLLLLVFAAALVANAYRSRSGYLTDEDMAQVRAGMTKAEVLKLLGEPVCMTRPSVNDDYLNWVFRDSNDADGCLFVQFEGATVRAIGYGTWPDDEYVVWPKKYELR